VITLEGLSSDREPPFEALDLALAAGELTAVVCPDDAERVGFVNLLLGQTPESGGRFLYDGEPLSARERRSLVTVLPRQAALAPDLNVAENISLVASVRDVGLDNTQRQRLLSFARIPSGKLSPAKVAADSQLRLTLALSTLGPLALVIALDPPKAVAQVLPDLIEPERVLLVVVPSLTGLEAQISRVHSLAHGRLGEGAGAATGAPRGRRYRIRVAPSTADVHGVRDPQALLASQPGVTVSRAPNGEFVLDLDADVAGSRLMRLLVQAGVVVESIREEGARAG
jgi:ABC-type transport system involved in cytochrome c biogenesis ATPase subunit